MIINWCKTGLSLSLSLSLSFLSLVHLASYTNFAVEIENSERKSDGPPRGVNNGGPGPGPGVRRETLHGKVPRTISICIGFCMACDVDLSRRTVQITSRIAVFDNGVEASVFSGLKTGKTLNRFILRPRDWSGSIFFFRELRRRKIESEEARRKMEKKIRTRSEF